MNFRKIRHILHFEFEDLIWCIPKSFICISDDVLRLFPISISSIKMILCIKPFFIRIKD